MERCDMRGIECAGIEAAWEAWLLTAGWSITDIKGTFAAGYRAALTKKEGGK